MIILTMLVNLVLGGAMLIEGIFLVGFASLVYLIYKILKTSCEDWRNFLDGFR